MKQFCYKLCACVSVSVSIHAMRVCVCLSIAGHMGWVMSQSLALHQVSESVSESVSVPLSE